jgi:hypothetical protein
MNNNIAEIVTSIFMLSPFELDYVVTSYNISHLIIHFHWIPTIQIDRMYDIVILPYSYLLLIPSYRYHKNLILS